MCHSVHIGSSFFYWCIAVSSLVYQTILARIFSSYLYVRKPSYIPACLYNRSMFLWVRMNTFLMLLNLEKSVETQA